jgi:hypothetical protein
MALRKKAISKDPIGDWAPPCVARFPDEASRDRFLLSVAAGEHFAWQVEPDADDDRGARVRWRAGHFLSLNDMVYAQQGRINITVARRTGTGASGVLIARRHGGRRPQ